MTDFLVVAATVMAALLCVWFVVLFARHGITGTWDAMMTRVRPAVERVMYGPPAQVTAPTVAELEADVLDRPIEDVIAEAERRA